MEIGVVVPIPSEISLFSLFHPSPVELGAFGSSLEGWNGQWGAEFAPHVLVERTEEVLLSAVPVSHPRRSCSPTSSCVWSFKECLGTLKQLFPVSFLPGISAFGWEHHHQQIMKKFCLPSLLDLYKSKALQGLLKARDSKK